ncbi:hypothetical protein NDU88_001664 [Pleurodeles waltl]|uniref:Uncharacterized protein n=1 Tax=Pleurodeles waltl TaxID=8319 RepID=A0AAV7LBZ5_PLEWA|nr:hypothetical protein NDU88_001664 [Pleurodeles waltl]
MWVPGTRQHRRQTAHSAVPPAHTGALSDALQHVLCPPGGRPPLNDLYNSPHGSLRTSILVVGTRPARTPPADGALCHALSALGRLVQCAVACLLPGRVGLALQRPLQAPWESVPCRIPHSSVLLPRYGCWPSPSPPADRAPIAHGHFIQCTAACSLLSRDESALQCAPLASAKAAGGTASLRESPVSVTAASPPAPAGTPVVRDQTPPCSSGPPVPLGTDSTSRWSPRVGYFQKVLSTHKY